jgi:hypothetical protein
MGKDLFRFFLLCFAIAFVAVLSALASAAMGLE